MNDLLLKAGFSIKSVEERNALREEVLIEMLKQDIIPVVRSIEEFMDDYADFSMWSVCWKDIAIELNCRFDPENKEHLQIIKEIYEGKNFKVSISERRITISVPNDDVSEA